MPYPQASRWAQVTREPIAAMPDTVRAMTLATALGILAIGWIYLYDSAPLAVAASALVMLIIVATWQPVVALGLIAASLPLFHEPFQTGDTVLAPSELLLAATLFGTATRLATDATRSEARMAGMRRAVVAHLSRLTSRFGIAALGGLLVISLVGFGLLAGVDNPDASAAGLREVRWTFIEPMVFVGLLLWHVTNPRRVAYVLGSFIAGGLLVAVWGLVDAATGGGVSVSGVVRASGPFPHPNAFGLYLLRPVVLGAALLLITGSRSKLLWLLCGVGAAALTASFSRGAALGLLVGGLLLLPWMTRRIRTMAILGASALGLALIALAGDRVAGASGADSLALRLDIWRSGLAMIRDRPLAGYGPDQFLYVYSPRYIDPAAWAERFTSHGHNLIIDSWVRVGIIGAVLAVFALAFIARSANTATRAHYAGRFDAPEIAAVVVLAAAGMQCLVDNGYFVHDLAMSAWLIAWAAFGRSAPSQQRGALLHERDRDGRSGPRWLASL